MLSRNLFRVYHGLTRSPMRSIPQGLQKPIQSQFPTGQFSTTVQRMEKKPSETPEANQKEDTSAPNLRDESPSYNSEKKADEFAEKAAEKASNKAKEVAKNVESDLHIQGGKLAAKGAKKAVKKVGEKLIPGLKTLTSLTKKK